MDPGSAPGRIFGRHRSDEIASSEVLLKLGLEISEPTVSRYLAQGGLASRLRPALAHLSQEPS